MITYKDVMTADFTKLTTAADQWVAMADALKEVQTDYKNRVLSVSDDSSWSGQAAFVARPNFTVTHNEYGAAQKEARAIASILRDAHTQFAELRGKVKSAKEDAEAAGMKVSAEGIASFDYDSATSDEAYAARHDPGLRESESYWTKKIATAVSAVDDADYGVKLALRAAVEDTDVSDGTLAGFNGEAIGDIEKVEAQEFSDIATRINSGEQISAKELAAARTLLRDNEGNKVFTQTMLNTLGASNTLQFTNRLNDLAYYDDKNRKNQYLAIEKGLANSLAKATEDSDSKFYKEWRKELRQAGVEKFDLEAVAQNPHVISHDRGQQVRGYQSLVTLMQHGEGYSSQFLHDIADDIRSTEDESQGGNPEIWNLHGTFAGRDNGWFANDPLDGVLGIMSRDPDTATAYLDPGTEGKDHTARSNDRLEYLHSRDWEIIDITAWQGDRQYESSIDREDKDSQIGFAAALEAATTGREPGTPPESLGAHDASQARIMQDTIAILDDGGKGDEVPDNLQKPLARALSDYVADTHSILQGDGPDGRIGSSNIHTEDGESHLSTGKASLLRVMRGVSESDGMYDLLYETEKRFSAQYLSDSPKISSAQTQNVIADWDNRSRDVATVFGAMNAIGSDIILDERDIKIGGANDVARYGYHVAGGAVTGLAPIGDAAQRMIDAMAYEWSKDVINEAEVVARDEQSKATAIGVDGTTALIQSWADTQGAKGSPAALHAEGEAEQSYITGREEAYDALRTRK